MATINSNHELLILSGNANLPLAENVSNYLSALPDLAAHSLGQVSLTKFSDGESNIAIGSNARGRDVFVMQSGAYPANENLMDLLIMIDALKRAAAWRITAVLPYFPYARKDQKDKPRVPITAKLVADLITAAGADQVLTIDLHAGQIQGFFDLPVDNLQALPVFVKDIRQKLSEENLVIVSPDAGGMERAREYGKRLSADIAMIDKRRSKEVANLAEAMNVVGEVAGKVAIIVDDMVDTAGTLAEAAEALLNKGAIKVYAYATHAVLSGPALERINQSGLAEVVVTDTLPLADKLQGCAKIRVLPTHELIGEAIKRIHLNQSISSLLL